MWNFLPCRPYRKYLGVPIYKYLVYGSPTHTYTQYMGETDKIDSPFLANSQHSPSTSAQSPQWPWWHRWQCTQTCSKSWVFHTASRINQEIHSLIYYCNPRYYPFTTPHFHQGHPMEVKSKLKELPWQWAWEYMQCTRLESNGHWSIEPSEGPGLTPFHFLEKGTFRNESPLQIVWDLQWRLVGETSVEPKACYYYPAYLYWSDGVFADCVNSATWETSSLLPSSTPISKSPPFCCLLPACNALRAFPSRSGNFDKMAQLCRILRRGG